MFLQRYPNYTNIADQRPVAQNRVILRENRFAKIRSQKTKAEVDRAYERKTNKKTRLMNMKKIQINQA